MAASSSVREYTISLPVDLAQRAEALARQESRSVNDVFCDALKTYYARDAHDLLREIGEYAESRNPGYTEDDVPRVIREVRDERLHRKA